MVSVPPQSLRLCFKRALTAYLEDLNSPKIADPTQAFATSRDYLGALLGQLGPVEFMNRLDDETTRLAGQVEQDLRQRLRERGVRPDPAEVEDRVRECFEHALDRLATPHTNVPVE